MARGIWSGTINFGLVAIPVKLYTATAPHHITFHQEVSYENILKGHELDNGDYVTLTRQELEAIEPKRSHSMDIEDFVDLADEIRDIEEVENIPHKAPLSSKELELAKQLINSMSRDWDPERYEDTYHDRVMELIDKKARGEEQWLVPKRSHTKVLDLMDALRASLSPTPHETHVPNGKKSLRSIPKGNTQNKFSCCKKRQSSFAPLLP